TPLAAVPMTRIFPAEIVMPRFWFTLTVTPGSIVSVAPLLTVTTEVTVYGLPATDQVVFVEIVPPTFVPAGATDAERSTTSAAPMQRKTRPGFTSHLTRGGSSRRRAARAAAPS